MPCHAIPVIYCTKIEHKCEGIALQLLNRLNTFVDCSNSTGQILPSLPWNHEPSSLDHVLPLVLSWELLNALHKILVARPISRDELADQRNRTKAPPLIHCLKQRVRDTTELEARKHSTGLKHAVRLAQGLLLVREVPDPERHSVKVHAVIRHRELLCIRDEEIQVRRVCIRCLKRALAALSKHVGVDIRDSDAGVGGVVDVVGVVEHAEGDVTGAAGDVEDVPALRGGGAGGGCQGTGIGAGVEGAHEVVFPQAVDAEGHEVVHSVVGGSDGGKDTGDYRLISGELG